VGCCCAPAKACVVEVVQLQLQRVPVQVHYRHSLHRFPLVAGTVHQLSVLALCWRLRVNWHSQLCPHNSIGSGNNSQGQGGRPALA